MVVVVVVLNLGLALYLLYLTMHLWRLRKAFSQAAEALTVAERSTYAVLHGAPQAILSKQIGTREFRENYQKLQPKIQRAQQALTLLGMGRSLLLNPMLTQRLKKSARTRRSR